MKCDNYKYYEWYYDNCIKWECVVYARACHGCFEPKEIQYDEREIKNKTNDTEKSK